MSNHLSPVHCRPDVVNFLDRTIRSAVEQHLFDVNPLEDQHSDTHESTPCPSKVTPTARQRRRHQREQQHQEESQKHREKNRAPSVTGDTNKENVPSSSGSSSGSAGEDMSSRVDSQEGQRSHAERTPKPRKPKTSPTLMQLSENTAAHASRAGRVENICMPSQRKSKEIYRGEKREREKKSGRGEGILWMKEEAERSRSCSLAVG